MTQYIISQREILRRKKAFTSLLTSLLVSGILFSIDLMIYNVQTSLMVIVFFVIVFYTSRIFTFRYFTRLLQTKITLSKTFIEKEFIKSKTRCNYDDIEYIRIKKTSKGNIREIRIISKNNTDIVINGLHEFEKFACELTGKAGNKSIRQIKEPIDFDHPFFYPILGMAVSFIFVFGMKYSAELKYQSIRLILYFILMLNCIISLYFIVAKPLSKSLDNDKINLDYVFSLSVIIINIIMYFCIVKDI